VQCKLNLQTDRFDLRRVLTDELTNISVWGFRSKDTDELTTDQFMKAGKKDTSELTADQFTDTDTV
jgi:hypothetical protein